MFKYNPWDIKFWEQAEELAQRATAETGNLYLPYDYGTGVWPKFGIVECPKVGDKVSYGFNGDTYPDGEIIKVSASHKLVTTSTGHKFYRRKLTPGWIMAGGTWSLVPGHVHTQNPEF